MIILQASLYLIPAIHEACQAFSCISLKHLKHPAFESCAHIRTSLTLIGIGRVWTAQLLNGELL